MNLLRLTTLSLAGVAGLAACTAPRASAEPPATAPATQPASAALDSLLDGMYARGNDLTTLHATISKTEIDASLGEDAETRTGRLWFDRKSDTDVRIRVSLDSLRIGEKERKDRIEYMLVDGVLTDRNYRSRVEAQQVVQKPGQKIDLFKLGQGPFPLPIGQPRSSVYEMFEVMEHPSGKYDPANTARVKLVPRPGTDLARKFRWIEVWVDRADHLPRRIETLNAPGSVVTRTELSNVNLNTPLPADAFALEKVNEREWTIRIESN